MHTKLFKSTSACYCMYGYHVLFIHSLFVDLVLLYFFGGVGGSEGLKDRLFGGHFAKFVRSLNYCFLPQMQP